jgi:atypical dual specificity phosphatase
MFSSGRNLTKSAFHSSVNLPIITIPSRKPILSVFHISFTFSTKLRNTLESAIYLDFSIGNDIMNLVSYKIPKNILFLSAFIFAGLVLFEVARIKRFHVVKEDVLYRSGQPWGSEWFILSNLYGIRTVVNLREAHEDSDEEWLGQELAGVKREGFEYINLPIRNGDLPARDQVNQFLEIVGNPEKQPVLVHCAAGRGRTGFMVAAWRVSRCGWSVSEALEEMEQIYGKSLPETVPEMLSEFKPETVKVADSPG